LVSFILYSVVYLDVFLKFPLPWWEGSKGRGNYDEIPYALPWHPHPNPLPSRERGLLALYPVTWGILQIGIRTLLLPCY